MRLSEYSLFLEKESARLKKLRAGNVTLRPGMAAPISGGTRVIRIPHDDRYLIPKQTVLIRQSGSEDDSEGLNQYRALSNTCTPALTHILTCVLSLI